jgi:SAM-dependent methyltransferase
MAPPGAGGSPPAAGELAGGATGCGFEYYRDQPRATERRRSMTTPRDVAALFDRMAPDYEVLEPWYEHLYDVLHGLLARTLAPPAVGAVRPGRALDAGCGTGLQAGLLERLGWQVHGIDLAAALLARARSRLAAPRLARGDLQALPYADGVFDVAVCCGSTLSFVPDPAAALRELARVLRPGGRLLLECEHRWSLDLVWGLLSSLTGDRLGYALGAREAWRLLAHRTDEGVWAPYPGYGWLRLFTRSELHRWLGEAGLVPERWWGVHSLTLLLPSTWLHRPRLGRLGRALYAGLRRLDRTLTSSAVGRGAGASLVVLARRAGPGAFTIEPR